MHLCPLFSALYPNPNIPLDQIDVYKRQARISTSIVSRYGNICRNCSGISRSSVILSACENANNRLAQKDPSGFQPPKIVAARAMYPPVSYTHLNPQGVCYSDHVVDQLASMETAADDFRIFWDNAYGIHHIYEEVPLKDILKACKDAGHPERAYYFFSTSKISFPGAGISLIASGPENIKELKEHMSAQTIGHDKLNQLRHVRFFKTPENIKIHMKKLAEELRPKFDMVLDKLDQNLSGTGLASWSTPKGGYFVSLDTDVYKRQPLLQICPEKFLHKTA